MFCAYKKEYKHNDCVLETKQTSAIKLHKTSKCLWPVYIVLFLVRWMSFFFEIFINHLPKIHRNVLRKIVIDLLYFWDVYDINLCEKLAITVKFCFIETRLKQGYDDLRGQFLKITRHDKRFSNRGYSLFFLMNIF